MVGIEELQDPNMISERLDAFVKNYPLLLENPRFSSTIAKLRESVNINKKYISRVENGIKELEGVNLKTATSAQFENMRSSLDKVMSEVPNLPASSRDEFADRGEAISKNLSAAIDARRIARAKTMHAALSDYEALLSKYENFSEPRESLMAQEAKIKQTILPLLEDVSQLFKPSQADLERYSDIAQRVAVAASTYARTDEQYKGLLSSRSLDAYFDAIKGIESSSIQTADFSKKLSKITACQSSIKIGQLADFADEKSALASLSYSTLGKGDLPENKFMTDVYRHANAQKTYTYTIGELSTSKQNWSGGHEVIQNCEQIFQSGEVRNSKYMMSYIDGKQPRGELLSEGGITLESTLGKNVYDTANKRSYLKALEEVAKADVNPIYKMLLESKIFEKMNADKVASGLMFSPSAKARSVLVMNLKRNFSDTSWLFESQSKINFILGELYSKPIPDFELEARNNKRAIEIGNLNPLVMIGVADISGKKILFKESQGAIWGVNVVNGKFMRFADKDTKDLAPLSPIFSEQKTSKEILKEASEGL